MMRHRHWLVEAILLLAFLGTPGPAVAQTSRHVLDVPYVTQPANSGGGAALVMVLRYWGDANVRASDFGGAAESTQNGQAISALATAATSRGWRTAALTSGGAPRLSDLAEAVDLGRPAIVLVEVAPGALHYVVVLAVTTRDVVIHDPASRPFETMSARRFEEAWTAGGSAALVVIPAADPVSSPRRRTIDATVPADLPADAKCVTFITQAVANSRPGDAQGTERHLADATSRCQESAAAWRELAGLRFVNSQWEEARANAEKAVKAAPADIRSWQLLGASLFLQGNALEALRAWNRVGDPRVESIVVSGANRTSEAVIVERLGVSPRDVLTPSAFRRAARRSADLPSVSDAVVRYYPHDDTGASLEVDVNEGRLYPSGYAMLGNLVGRALVLHEAKLPFAGITGHGERLDVEYGWKRNRPKSAVRLTLPAPGAVPGLMIFEVLRSRQTFAGEGQFGSGRIIEDRDAFRVGLEDWATGRIHWSIDGLYNRLEQGNYLAIGGGLDTRLWDDRIALLLDSSSWSSTGDAPGFRLVSFAAKWRQRVVPGDGGFSAEAGATGASQDTPLSFWSGADVGSSREAYLRAHKLLTEGVVTSAVFGRRLTFGSLTYEQPIRRFKFGAATVAAFVDTAKAWDGMVPGRETSHTDVGLGLRFHNPAFSVRVDVGYGLRDQSTAISAAFVRPWPRR